MEEDEAIVIDLIRAYVAELTENCAILELKDEHAKQLYSKRLYYAFANGATKFLFMIDKNRIQVLNKLRGVQHIHLGDELAIKAFVRESLTND